MTVLGVGVDIVDIERFTRALERTPALRARLFGPVDTQPQDLAAQDLAAQDLAGQSLAARFAAKEATLKALGGNISGFSWHDIQVTGERGQQPKLVLSGGVAKRAALAGVTSTHLSMSHDGGMAIAFVVVDGEPRS
jgi:holo-[acyl-carrier protein] synthase